MSEVPWFARAEARGMSSHAAPAKFAAPKLSAAIGPGGLSKAMSGGPYGSGLPRRREDGGRLPLAARGPSAQQQPLHVGPVVSPVAGRTDHVMTRVPADSYVIPADVVSGHGEGNTMNGQALMAQAFGSPVPERASGGRLAPHEGVDVALSGGEFVVPPESVAQIGGGDLKRGHAILDSFVKQSRATHIKTLRKLPGPKRN